MSKLMKICLKKNMEKNNSEQGNVNNSIKKLCNYFARNNADLSANIFRLISKYFISTTYNANVDEQHILSMIRTYLETLQLEDVLRTFDLLYAKIEIANVPYKCSAMIFFLNMCCGPSPKDLKHWTILDDVPSKQSVVSSKSHITFLPDDPRIGVKKLYQGNLAKKHSLISNKTQVSIHTAWTNSENDFLKQCSLSTCSSRSTIINGVTEQQLIQEVIYSFQGIEGRIIRKDSDGLGFAIDPKASKCLTTMQKSLVMRLNGIGFLHNQLKQHCDEADKQIGLIGQSLIAILRDELAKYYQLIALLQAQTKKQACSDHNEITLRRMIVWVAEPQMQLQWLAHIAEQCSNKKGGALISVVHGFLQNGSTCVQKVSEKVLSAVCRPLYLMLSRWLLNGELNDPCGEFFIEARSINTAERLWHDKYHVRKTMIPSFITLDQANKILATGKSINFLRQICKDNEELPGRDKLQKLFNNTLAAALFTPEQSIELHSALESVYRETSLRVLDLLKNKHRLLEHLQALRRYILLGQGDFIRHLLELLAPELSKPAQNLYGHTLSAILESAIRVTNAQFEDEDTLQRLNVGLMDNTRDDTGWEVFSLVYLADGPVGTIFQPTVSTYKSLFGGLWKAKRMEFVLSNMRKQQITSNKLLKQIKELKPVTHAIHILASEMIHFLHQTQYYFLFEVLECSWAEMLRQVHQAGCLDDVIAAHSTFLNSVQCGILLDISSNELRLKLGLIFNLMLTLETLQETLYEAALKEKERQVAYREMVEDKEYFRVDKEVETENKERIGKFHQFLSSMNSQVRTLSTSFREHVVQYVTLLATSSDMNLQLLSTRLNFNDYYKIT